MCLNCRASNREVQRTCFTQVPTSPTQSLDNLQQVLQHFFGFISPPKYMNGWEALSVYFSGKRQGSQSYTDDLKHLAIRYKHLKVTHQDRGPPRGSNMLQPHPEKVARPSKPPHAGGRAGAPRTSFYFEGLPRNHFIRVPKHLDLSEGPGSGPTATNHRRRCQIR